MALKDKSNIVQQYALVNVNQFTTLISTGTSIQTCLESYTKLLADNGIKTDIDVENVVDPNGGTEQAPAEVKTVSGVIEDIRVAVIGGDSCYYLKVAGSGKYFAVDASDFNTVIIANKGDSVEITYKESEDAIVKADSFAIK